MPDEEYDEETEQLDPNIREALRRTKETARKADAAEARAAELERELAFAKAGIPDSPLTAALAKTYEGENDPASVKAYFEGLGVDLSGKQEVAQEQETQNALDEQRRLAQVGSQGEPGGDIRFEDAINSTKSVEDLMALIEAAPEGATTNVDGRNLRIRTPIIE